MVRESPRVSLHDTLLPHGLTEARNQAMIHNTQKHCGENEAHCGTAAKGHQTAQGHPPLLGTAKCWSEQFTGCDKPISHPVPVTFSLLDCIPIAPEF